MTFTMILSKSRAVESSFDLATELGFSIRKQSKISYHGLLAFNLSYIFSDTVLGNHLQGTVSYSEGFVITIQNVDILRESLTQVFTDQPDGTVRVEMRGQLRIIDMEIGWDVNTNINGNHYYTGVVRIPLIRFNFSVSTYL